MAGTCGYTINVVNALESGYFSLIGPIWSPVECYLGKQVSYLSVVSEHVKCKEGLSLELILGMLLTGSLGIGVCTLAICFTIS